jgi:hypothetical protein
MTCSFPATRTGEHPGPARTGKNSHDRRDPAGGMAVIAPADHLFHLRFHRNAQSMLSQSGHVRAGSGLPQAVFSGTGPHPFRRPGPSPLWLQLWRPSAGLLRHPFHRTIALPHIIAAAMRPGDAVIGLPCSGNLYLKQDTCLRARTSSR